MITDVHAVDSKRADLRGFEQLCSQSEILMCQSSYCKPKVEPHERVPNIKQVMMIDLVENINPKIIQNHDRPLELFCRDDHRSEEDHKTHDTVPVEDESEMKKKNKEKEEADNIDLCTDLNYSTERCQPEAKTRMNFLLLLSSCWIYKRCPLQKG